MALAEQKQANLVLATEPVVPAYHARSLPRAADLVSVTSVADFLAIERDWKELERQTAATTVFQSFDWLAAWAGVYATEENPLAVVTGYRAGRLAFALPLMKTRVGPITVLRWMSEPLGQYGDALVAEGEDAASWMDHAVSAIRQQRSADVIRLRHVRQDAAAAPWLDAHFRDALMNEQAPWLDLSAFADEAAYDARYTSNQRKRRKKIRKVLEDDFGPVSFEMLHAGPACDTAIAGLVVEKCHWLDDRGRQNRALCEVQTVDFLRRLSRSATGRVQLVTSQLTAGGNPLSWEVGLRCGGTHFGFITSHVTAHTDYSPGRLHMDLSQRRALSDGMKAFDLMVPNDAHKDSWSSARMDTRDYHLPLTSLGRLYGIGYLETARPLLRKTYYRMPPNLLRLLKPVTGH